MPGSCRLRPDQIHNIIPSLRQMWREIKSSTVSSAGTNDLFLTVVPSGEIWYVVRVLFRNSATASPLIIAAVRSGGVSYWFSSFYGYTVNQYRALDAGLYLVAGEQLHVRFTGCSVNDVIEALVTGHKMLVEY